MTSVCKWIFTLTLNWLVCLSECTCFLPEIYNIGVLKIGRQNLHSTFTTRWCDDVLLCGRAPLSLRVTTIETQLNKSTQVTKSHSQVNLWLFTTSIDVNSNSTSVVTDYFRKDRRHFLDYTQQNLPETDADWCALVVKFAYGKSSDHDPDYSYLHVDYVLSVVDQAHFNTVVIVYDNTTDMEVLHLSEGLSKMNILHVLHNTASDAGQKEANVLRSYWGLERRVVNFEDYTNVLVWCDSSCTRRFLDEISPKTADAGTDLYTQHMTRVLIIDASLQTNVTSPVVHNQSSIVTGNQSASSLLVTHNESMTQELEDILALVRNFFHVAVLWKGEDCIRLQTMMKTPTGGRFLSYSGFGDNRGHVILTSEAFPNTKWWLNGQKFTVATAIWEPFVMVTEVNGKDMYTGLCIDMLQALAMSLNFTYELVTPADGQYGSIENGNWTGLVRMLKDKKAQLVVAPIAVDELRATVVDFSTPFYQDYTGVLFKRPDPALHKWKTYFRPFSWQVLMLIGISFVLATAFGHIVGVKSAEVIFPRRELDSDVFDTVQYFFGSLLAQGGVWNPATGSARMFVSGWWIFCVIMAAIYSGNLTASFAVTLYDPSFTTLQEMLDEGSYDFGTVPGTIWFDIFKFSERSDFQQIEQEMVEFSRIHAGEKINETEDHVRRATNDYYAYISNMASLLPAVDENCDLMVLEETFLPLQYAIALQKDSPLTDTVSTWILQMNEGGLDLLWASHWWTSTEGKCGTNKMTEMNVVTLMDCQSAFYVLLLGFVVSLLAVCGESVFHWFVRRKYQTGTDEHIPTSPTRWENGGPKSLWDLSNSFSSRPSGGLRSLWELSSTDSSSSIRPSPRASSKTNGHACNGISSISRPELDDVFDDITDFNHGLQSVFTDDEPTCNHRRNGAVHFNV